MIHRNRAVRFNEERLKADFPADFEKAQSISIVYQGT